jgi:hypothetical protein
LGTKRPVANGYGDDRIQAKPALLKGLSSVSRNSGQREEENSTSAGI